MGEENWGAELRALSERLARLEEGAIHRGVQIARIEHTLEQLTKTVADIADNMRDAKTGMRLGLWLGGTVAPALGGMGVWLFHTFWPGK